MKKTGFTLIELVIVIVLLGILSAVAIPKFVGLQDSARGSAADGALGAIRGAINIYYAQQATSTSPSAGTFPPAIVATFFADNKIPSIPPPYSFSYNSSTGVVTKTTVIE